MTPEVSGFGKRVVKVVDKSSEMDSFSYKPINSVATEHPTHKLHPVVSKNWTLWFIMLPDHNN
jgi:hypothetical protein